MPGTTRLAIVADDLTGALDAAAPFAAGGLPVLVAVTPEAIDEALAAAPAVVAVNTQTRALPPGEAALRVDAAAARLAAVGRVVKKIDSRLKGNVVAETLALAGARGARAVLLCPAIPEMGRTVADGRLVGTGVAEPLPVLAGAWAGVAVRAPDAASDADLDALVAAVGDDELLVGARGLTAALARRLCGPHAGPEVIALPLAGPVLLAVGSRDPITLAQLDRLAGLPGLARVAAPGGAVPAGLPRSAVVLVQAVEAGAPRAAEAVAAAFAEGLAAAGIAAFATVVLSGGDTAAAVLRRCGARVLRIVGEASPGLPVCRVAGRAEGPAIVTKSGGFGAPDALLRLVAAPPAARTGGAAHG